MSPQSPVRSKLRHTLSTVQMLRGAACPLHWQLAGGVDECDLKSQRPMSPRDADRERLNCTALIRHATGAESCEASAVACQSTVVQSPKLLACIQRPFEMQLFRSPSYGLLAQIRRVAGLHHSRVPCPETPPITVSRGGRETAGTLAISVPCPTSDYPELASRPCKKLNAKPWRAVTSPGINRSEGYSPAARHLLRLPAACGS